MEFLTRVHGRLPMWAWIGMGVVAVLIYRSVTNNKAMAVSSSNQYTGNNGNAASPNVFFLPQGAQPSGTSYTVNINRNPANYLPAIVPGNMFTPPPVPRTVPPPNTPHSNSVTVAHWPGTITGGLSQWNTTLWGIAQHFGTTVENLQTLNNIQNPNLIYPGEEIKVN